MKTFLYAGLSVLILVFLVIVGCGGGDDDESSGDVTVPIDFEGASDIGSIHMELVYDSAVLEVTGVEAGELAENAMVEYNPDTAGLVVIGIVDAGGINGDGTVVTVGFNILDDEETSLLTLKNVEIHDVATLIDIIINQISDGYVSEEGDSVTAPVVSFLD